MMCHRCEHQDAIRAGKFRGKRFEETPCATCDWREPSSVFTIPFDDARAAATPVDGEQPFPEEADAEELKVPMSVMTAALAMIMALRARTRDALCDRYLGKLYREIAGMQGVTVAAIEVRHKRALERWPELRALFPLKVAKQARRRPHCRRGGRRSRAEQGVAGQ
jgi:DNA-directed RNA polymerase specialized sigma24 family protein